MRVFDVIIAQVTVLYFKYVPKFIYIQFRNVFHLINKYGLEIMAVKIVAE